MISRHFCSELEHQSSPLNIIPQVRSYNPLFQASSVSSRRLRGIAPPPKKNPQPQNPADNYIYCVQSVTPSFPPTFKIPPKSSDPWMKHYRHHLDFRALRHYLASRDSWTLPRLPGITPAARLTDITSAYGAPRLP